MSQHNIEPLEGYPRLIRKTKEIILKLPAYLHAPEK